MGKRASYDTDYAQRSGAAPETQATLTTETSRRFHDLMDNAMLVSFYKYGAVANGYPERVNAIDSLRLRLDAFLHGKRNSLYDPQNDPDEPEFIVAPGNVEYLVDIANFAMIEFMHPAHTTAYYKATDSEGSTGRVASNTAIYDKPTQGKNNDLPDASEKPLWLNEEEA